MGDGISDLGRRGEGGFYMETKPGEEKKMTNFSEDEAIARLRLMAEDLKEAAFELSSGDPPDYRARVKWIGEINEHIQYLVQAMKEQFR